MVLDVVGHLLSPSALGLVNGELHAFRYGVGIHYHLAVYVSCGSSGSLCQRPV